ncbi:response regulator [Spirochaetia bacterium 38H-sp]|uniref:Response regulator n=1 Tax=Rarispira pelagica TaxID=3141764 RepID=A0ABU9U8Q3_9SPIR
MKKILYAEDEFTSRSILEAYMTKAGAKCCFATDGEAALKLFGENSFDLVILDQYMPIMSGDKVAAIIRESGSDIPILAITSDEGEIEKLKKAGITECFIKPLHKEDYLYIIEKYLK